MGLSDQVREHCAAVAAGARWVTIDDEALEGVDPGPEPSLDPERHYLEGAAEDVAAYMLALDSINFGSGWFPTLRKRPGCSGYNTIAWALADHWRANGPWSAAELRRMDPDRIALVLGQDPGHELMALYAEALRQLGSFLRGRASPEAIAAADGSAQRLAELLAHSMPFYDDTGFWKRAQIVPSDMALAGVAEFSDLDSLTIFADNVVPHVLRVDGALRYHPDLAAHIDAGRLLPPGEQEREIRACAVHACETIAGRLEIAPRALDNALWNRGQAPRYKAIPRHRTRSVFY
ncbi:MAG TPA: queuosine salvage family protein [Thermoleophilaceae bacterium]|nr:queuosine salvage family protein [Thermoleophilaceae bacterium]